MKRLSIKLRVTLWFTLLMTLLAALSLAFLFAASSRAALNDSRAALVGMVEANRDEIEFDDGALEFDDDIEYFKNGVYLAVFDEAGSLLYGRLPNALGGAAPFKSGDVQAVDANGETWYVYDSLEVVEGYGGVWMRAMASGSGASYAMGSMLRFALIALPFYVLIAAVGGYVLVSRAFEPVRRITATANEIGESRDLSRRIGIGEGRDEIYRLAAAFDAMFDKLEETFEKEKQFTSDASHELRTPTAVIISQCELALSRAQTINEAKAALEGVLAQAEKMSALISQLLTLARADKGNERLNLELVNLSELAEVVAEQMHDAATARGISIITDIQPNIILRGDETLLMRMLINLVDNGIKYGKPGGSLALNLSLNGQTARGSVSDDGIGIAPENIARVWERFYQADTSRTQSGAGLGLSMVKWIAEAHGGSVSVKSAVGRGSEFSFALPVSN